MTPKPDGRAATLIVGFVALILSVAIISIVFALVGIEPARESGPLPFLVK